jgi:phosphotransacetylase
MPKSIPKPHPLVVELKNAIRHAKRVRDADLAFDLEMELDAALDHSRDRELIKAWMTARRRGAAQ